MEVPRGVLSRGLDEGESKSRLCLLGEYFPFRALSVCRLRRLAGLMLAGTVGRSADFLPELWIPDGVLECFKADLSFLGVDLDFDALVGT